MKKIYIGDDPHAEDELEKPHNVESLRKALVGMAVYTEMVETRRGAKVMVPDGVGTTMMLANIGDDLINLKDWSSKKERIGDRTIYHFIF